MSSDSRLKTQGRKQGLLPHPRRKPQGLCLHEYRAPCLGLTGESTVLSGCLSIHRERLTENSWGKKEGTHGNSTMHFGKYSPHKQFYRLVGRGWTLAPSSRSSRGERSGDLARGRRRTRSHTTEKQTKVQEGKAMSILLLVLVSVQYPEN